MQSLHPVKVSKLGSFPDELTAQPSPKELYLILTNCNSNLISILGARGLRVPAASGPTNFMPPRVTPARSPCQVITEPAAACPVGALRSEITPPETKAAGRGERMLTYICHHTTTGPVFYQSSRNFPAKIPATRRHVTCRVFV